VRQPLAAALVRTRRPEEWEKLGPFIDQISEELNVKSVDYLASEGEVAQYVLKPNLPALGPRLGPDLPKLVTALKALDATAAVAQLKRGERLDITIGDRKLSLGMDDVQPQAVALPGYAVAEEHGYLVALVTDLTDELVDEGLAREVVHRLQTLRKSAGFEVADRIVVAYDGGVALKRVLDTWSSYIKAETLAVELRPTVEGADGFRDETPVEGEPATFVLRTV
jgi:isoleucyl-tRNA synthetase